MAVTKKKIVKKVKSPAVAAVAEKIALPEGTYEGYCVKCKAKGVKYQGTVEVSKTGMNMAKGPCPTCGTKICRILGKAK